MRLLPASLLTLAATLCAVPSPTIAQPAPDDRTSLNPRLRPDLLRVRVIRHSVDTAKGKLARRSEYRFYYGKRGELTREEARDARGRLVNTIKYAYDAAHRLHRKTIKSGKHKPLVRTRTYKLDKQGRIDEVTITAPKLHKVFRSKYIHDAKGAIRIHEFDRGTRYDKNEYRRGSRAYDTAGRLTRRCSTSGLCSMFWYDRQGNLAGQRDQDRHTHNHRNYRNTYDAKGRLATSRRGGQLLTYQYNQRGDVISVTSEIRGKLYSRRNFVYRYR